jgi:hypothetical protein
LLINVRLPIESARSTRSLNERAHFKANEWRNLAFYLIIPILRKFMSGSAHLPAYNNLVKYVVFLRILCQDSISASDLVDAKEIMNDFIVEFESLYGPLAMTSNIHSHMHLVEQVKRFGPLPKCSCFAFENMFRYFYLLRIFSTKN